MMEKYVPDQSIVVGPCYLHELYEYFGFANSVKLIVIDHKILLLERANLKPLYTFHLNYQHF